MIERHPCSDGTVLLRFTLPIDHPGQPIAVAGDVNGWEWTSTPLSAVDDALVAGVVVPGGTTVELRYRSANGASFNDEHADDDVDNELGGVNCVVHTAPAEVTTRR